MPTENNWLSSEAEILLRIVGSRSTFANTIHFLLAGAFPYPEHAFGQDVLVAINVPRERLNLSLGLKPGDIDLLVIPVRGLEIFPERAMAAEAKILRPTLERPERNVNKMGVSQAIGLLRDGFPFVGLIHISIPERLPKELLWPVKHLTGKILSNGKPEEKDDFILIDPFPIFSAQRQLGRLKNTELPEGVGYNAISLSISHDGQEFVGNTLGDDRRSLKNSSVSEDLIESISNLVKLRPEDFLRASWK